MAPLLRRVVHFGKILLPLVSATACLAVALGAGGFFSGAAAGEGMQLLSPAFEMGGLIPSKYTCDGADISPPIRWSSIPSQAESLALICDDPDAPAGTWVHWVYYDIPVGAEGLPENIPSEEDPNAGGRQGRNSFRKIGYGGPCPPGGTHRYVFTLYALDTMLGLPPGVEKDRLLKSMGGHVIEKAQLVGRYERE